MDDGVQNQEGLPEKNLRKQLAAAVRNIQWCYGIFWSVSSKQQGVLEWCDGYYNGDVKTRKMTQPMELKADQFGLLRSEQLRELYESLSAGDSIPQARRPSASLSPEDLTDTEWYYLVCMSFTFGPDEGLPGKVFASNKHIWLNNVQFADSKIFVRSLLAKSAYIQTVVCFPFVGGVLELGSTEQVAEGTSLIEHVTSSFWVFTFPVCSEQSISSPAMIENDDNVVDANFGQEVANTAGIDNNDFIPECLSPLEISSSFPFPSDLSVPNKEMGVRLGSPNDSLNEFFLSQQADDSLRMEELNATSQVQSRQLINDEFNNGLHASLNSSEFIAQSFVNPQKVLSSPMGERPNRQVLDSLQDGNYSNLISLEGDDTHYTKTMAAIVKNSRQLAIMPYFRNNSYVSNFIVWRRGLNTQIPQTIIPQNMLKKVVVDFAQRHCGASQRHKEENGLRNRIWRTDGDEAGASHMLSERRRREKLNEKFLILRSLVPSISKVDKASILGDTIEYIKELEKRVEELESSKELADVETRERKKHPDVTERTSDNYGNHATSNGRLHSGNKRKSCSIDEAEAEHHWILSKDGLVDVGVTITESGVMIELHCPWRDNLLFDVMDAINKLHLDVHSTQSTNINGVFGLTVKAKFRGSVNVASPGMIKSALQGVIGKS